MKHLSERDSESKKKLFQKHLTAFRSLVPASKFHHRLEIITHFRRNVLPKMEAELFRDVVFFFWAHNGINQCDGACENLILIN